MGTMNAALQPLWRHIFQEGLCSQEPVLSGRGLPKADLASSTECVATALILWQAGGGRAFLMGVISPGRKLRLGRSGHSPKVAWAWRAALGFGADLSHVSVPVVLRSPLPLPQAHLAQLVMAVPLCARVALSTPPR